MANGGDVIFNFKGDTSNLDKATKTATNTLKGIGSFALKTIGIASAAIGTAVAGVATTSIRARGEIEQSLGGIETLFKKSASKVVKNAQKAYKTAGLSANQYMEQATSFSAALLQGLKGDTEKATKIADMAIIDMADNANKMGTSIEMIQNAYQGFAKQNYTMLDNLKLGYGGTKSEMVRLVKESGILGKASKDLTLKNFEQKVSFDQIIEAIHKVQQNMNITGTTSKEASETLQGSVASFKASWQNLLSGMGTSKEVLESLKPVIKNVSKIAKEAIKDIWKEMKSLIGGALEPVANWIEKHKNGLIVLTGVIGTLTTAIIAHTVAQNLDLIITWAYVTATNLAAAATSFFAGALAFLTSPITLVIAAIGALITIGVLLANNWEQVKTTVLNVWNGIKTGVSNGVNAVKGFFSNLGAHIGEKVNDIKTKIGEFGSKFGQLPGEIWKHLTNAYNKFVNFVVNLATKAKEGIRTVINNIKNGFSNLPGNMLNIGKNIVQGLWNGIGNTAQWLFNKIKSFKDAVLNKFKSFFGINSPSTLFRDEVGIFMAQGIGEGFTDEMSSVSKQMNKALATVGLGDMFEMSPTLNRTTSNSNNVNIQVINNMETDLMGNIVNNIKTFTNGAKNDYNYGMAQ